MSHLKTYHRPQTIEAALELLNRPQVYTMPLAGGTFLNANLPTEVEELVDLQSLHLTQITHVGDTLTLGALVRLQELVELGDSSQSEPRIFHPITTQAISPLALLRQTALLEGPNTMRHAATIGGVIVTGDNESELLAAMLVCAAEVTIQKPAGSQTMPLANLLAAPVVHLAGGLITSISLHLNGQAAHDRVARTPKDRPIVAAVARHDGANHWLALCGVAPTPILLTLDQLDNLTPPSDFRGSADYRLAMARVLVGRVNVSE